MTSEDNVSIEEKEKSLITAATDGRWPKVLTLYASNKDIRLAKMATSGDTVLHMAVSSGKEYVVALLVDLVCSRSKHGLLNNCLRGGKSKEEESASENGDEKKNVLGAQNEKGNTPLHLAASRGNVMMCRMILISSKEPSLAFERNKAGETPLFMAALGGHRKAFLWLHYKGCPEHSEEDLDPCIKRNNHDTILHCALEGKHIDVAIEIVHLYKNKLKQMIMRNESGVSPLHILAATPSAFESTHLHGRPFIVRFLHCWPCFRVKRKTQATTEKELKQEERELPYFHRIKKAMLSYADRLDYSGGSSWAKWIMCKIVMLPCFLAVILLIPLVLAESLLDGIRNLNERYKWCLQIVDELLQLASVKDISGPYEEDSGKKI